MKSNRKMLGIILMVIVLFVLGAGIGNIFEPSDRGETADAEASEKSSELESEAEESDQPKKIEDLEGEEGIIVHKMKIGYENQLYPKEISQIEDGSGELYIGAQDLAKVIGADLQWNGISKQIILKNEQDYIIVDTEESVILDSEGNEEKVKLYESGKKTILPSGRVMSYFGYQISKLGELGIFRIKNPDSELLDIEFSKKYEAEFGKQIEDYEFKYRHERAMFEEQYPQKKKTIVMKELPDEKVAYLTFDDGPNEFTPQILDILKSYDAKATFFVLGNSIYGKEDILRRTYQEGHSIGLHSMNHVYREVYASPANFVSQMDQCNELVKSAIGVKTRLIRPPYGSKPQLTDDFRNAAVERGYRIWDWNIDSGDAVGNRGSAGVYNYTTNQASRFEGPVVILFHDKVNTAQALPSIIDYLSGRGYRFEAVTEDLMPFNFWGDKRYVN